MSYLRDNLITFKCEASINGVLAYLIHVSAVRTICRDLGKGPSSVTSLDCCRSQTTTGTEYIRVAK